MLYDNDKKWQFWTANIYDIQKQANAEASDKLQAERSQTSCSSSSKYSCILGLSDEGYSHGVTGLLAKSCDVLYQAFEGVGRARDARIQATGKDIVDVTLIKVMKYINLTNWGDSDTHSLTSNSSRMLFLRRDEIQRT